MPEANVLYSVTAFVVVGLVAWVALVLKTAKEPWARAGAIEPRTADVPVEPEEKPEAKADDEPAKAAEEEPAKAAEEEPAKAAEEEPAKASGEEKAADAK